jgi:DNA repair exonuclease SbcCD ATPase subunit
MVAKHKHVQECMKSIQEQIQALHDMHKRGLLDKKLYKKADAALKKQLNKLDTKMFEFEIDNDTDLPKNRHKATKFVHMSLKRPQKSRASPVKLPERTKALQEDIDTIMTNLAEKEIALKEQVDFENQQVEQKITHMQQEVETKEPMLYKKIDALYEKYSRAHKDITERLKRMDTLVHDKERDVQTITKDLDKRIAAKCRELEHLEKTQDNVINMHKLADKKITGLAEKAVILEGVYDKVNQTLEHAEQEVSSKKEKFVNKLETSQAGRKVDAFETEFLTAQQSLAEMQTKLNTYTAEIEKGITAFKNRLASIDKEFETKKPELDNVLADLHYQLVLIKRITDKFTKA